MGRCRFTLVARALDAALTIQRYGGSVTCAASSVQRRRTVERERRATHLIASRASRRYLAEDTVDTTNPARGPLLKIFGDKDHTVPPAFAEAAYKRQQRNAAVTEITEMPDRGHALTIDHGWKEVADTALAFVKQHA